MIALPSNPAEVHADDICALPLVKRLAATLDLDPSHWRDGDLLPRGWHLAYFSTDTRTSDLRADGVAGFGIPMPELGLPRIVFGGREIEFHGDIPIGSRLKRISRLGGLDLKDGRSGRLAVVSVEHDILVDDDISPRLQERQTYIMREAIGVTSAPAKATGSATTNRQERQDRGRHHKVVVPNEVFLFRLSAVMFNPHRIHYDLSYSREKEGYPALLVNGSATALLLLTFYREVVGVTPKLLKLKNLGLAYCGEPMHLNLEPEGNEWRLWSTNDKGDRILEGVLSA